MSYRRALLLISVLAVAGCAATATPMRPTATQNGAAAGSSQVVVKPKPPAASFTGFRHLRQPEFEGYMSGH